MKADIELLIAELRLPGGLSKEAKNLADSVRAALVAEYNKAPAGSLRRGHTERALKYLVRSCFNVDGDLRIEQEAAASALENLLPHLCPEPSDAKDPIDEKIPASYRYEGTLSGPPLTVKFCKDRFRLSGSTLSRKGEDDHIKVGGKCYYEWAFIKKLADEK